MTQEFGLFCLVLLSFLKIFNAAFIPLRSLIPSTSTYKPSTLLLPPGFESQKAPPEPMLYPYAVSSAGTPSGHQMKLFSSTTPDWIPVALNVNSDLHLKQNLASTTPTPSAAPVLEDRISNDEPKYSSPAYKEGPVFESIVYGTWKPEPLKKAKVASQQLILGSKNNANSSSAIGNGKVFNKTINRQHGGFIGNIQQKPVKFDRQISIPTSSTEKKSKDLTEPKLPRKIRKQGRRKIRPIIGSTTEESSSQDGEQVATARTATTKEYAEPQQNIIKVNSTDPKLMEVVKQINESLEIKYNHKQTSTHSIDMMMTTAEASNYGDVYEADGYGDSGRLDATNVQWTTKPIEFLSTEPQLNYDDYSAEKIRDINATRRSWPTDFMEAPLTPTTTTDVSYQSVDTSHKAKFNDSLAADSSEIPLALSALNIPASLWPKLPGNITKLGKPYEAESSAEEPALCVPITVREQNIMNSNELIYIERVFCFPMPLSTTSEKTARALETTSISSSTTPKAVTTTKVQNFDDFVDSHPRASKANNFKTNIFLVASFIVIYLEFIF